MRNRQIHRQQPEHKQQVQQKIHKQRREQLDLQEYRNKRMPVWALILIDILLTVIGLGAFSFYQLMIPRSIQHAATVLASPEISGDTFRLPDTSKEEALSKEKTPVQEKARSTPQKSEAGKGNYSNTGTMDIASDTSDQSILSTDRIVTEVNHYKDPEVEFATQKIEVGSGSEKITYYVSDVYVTNVKYIKTAFAKGKYGKNYRDRTAAMAKENSALLAISGDYYGNGETGIVIRNGVLYRSDGNDADICVLYTDGTMKTYSPEEFAAEDVIKKSVWQAWTFGPQLLDGEGNILSSFNTTPFLNSINPRCAIGSVEPGHYVFLVVDGRNEGYSRGVSLSELAQLMKDTGCKVAYNLDGGKSAGMVYNGDYVNQPCEGGRAISDIIYIGE